MMRLTVFAVIIGIMTSLNAYSQDYVVDIEFKVKGTENTTCLLAYRFGKKVFVKDSIKVDNSGVGKIQYEEALASGVYLYVFPDNNFIEFIVSEQKFGIQTDKDDILAKIEIENSRDNELFYQYRKFIDPRGAEIQKIQEELTALQNDSTSDNEILISEKQRQMNAINEDIVGFRENMMEKFPEAFITRMFFAMKDPEVPEPPILPNGRPDSTFAYKYFKEHYFDHISFQDSALLRTPIFEDKVKYYMESLVIQIPDSVNKELDDIIGQAKGNQIMTEFLLKTFTSKYERSKLMGAENIFVHLVETYYNDEQYTPWLDSAQRARILKRGRQLSPIIIGKKAPNLVMLDYYNKPQSLHNIDAEFTILYFWAFDCGHCKKVTPKLKTFYEEVKGKGVEVFAVSTKQELDGWKDYVKDKELPWINVHDQGGRNRIHDVYDIYSTPVIYLLDKDKKIIAKRLDVENLKKILELEMKKAN